MSGTMMRDRHGKWVPAEPLPVTGILGRAEAFARRRGWSRLSGVLAHLDEAGLGEPGLHIGAATIYREPRDWWIGYYRGDAHHYVCPLPTIVVRWERKGVDVRYRDWTCVVVDGKPYAARGRIKGTHTGWRVDRVYRDTDTGAPVAIYASWDSPFRGDDRRRSAQHVLEPVPPVKGWPGWAPHDTIRITDEENS